MIWTVLTVLAYSAAFLLVLLCVPIQIGFRAERCKSLEIHTQFSWLFGLVRFRVHSDVGQKKSSGDEGSAKGSRKKFAAHLGRHARRGFLRPALLARGVIFLRDVLRAIRPRDLRLYARIGMEDPADTGQLCGLLGLIPGLYSHENIRIVPHFGEACLEYQGCARVRLIPLQLIALVIGFAFSPPMLRVLVSGQ